MAAQAKVNLCLEVLDRRADGMHEVATVLQTITLADRLEFRPSHGPGPVTLTCTGMRVAPDNLILRAAALLREVTGVQYGCHIHCEKRIPVEAGLGGGSADAAATLRALNSLWHTDLEDADLAALAGRIGADVPFLLHGGTALATGTGAEIAPLPPAPRHWIVLVPRSAESQRKTAEMYAALSPASYSDGACARRMSMEITAGRLPYEAVRSAFRDVVIERWPAAGRALLALGRGCARASAVSGSGPSVFGLYDDRAAAEADADRLGALGISCAVHAFSSEIVDPG